MNYDYLIPLVKRWVAGKTLDEALIVSRQANMKGYHVVLNYLGEEITDEKQIRYTVLEYKKMIDIIRREKLNAAISLKLTQLGLSLNESLCEDNLNEIVKHAKNNKLTIWIDMENSKYTDKTIKIYLKFLKEYHEIGVAIQAYLKRGFELAKLVAANDGMIRLVKGAYKEPSSIVYTSKEDINRNFNEIMQYLFEKRTRLELGTHDEKLVYNAIKLLLKTKHNIEFAFLRGIRNDLKSWLVKEGFKVVEYIPYGPSWKDYVYRRIREKKSNILLALTSIFTK